jgi:glycerophosphoryl diester phosphodiesterase
MPPAAASATDAVFAGAPVLCGHRGSGKGVVEGRRENTLGSFRAAVAAGLPWVEVDARTTADAVLVASHDPVVDDGRFIADLTADETDGLGLMRVADLFEDLPADVAVDVDLKTSLEDALRPAAATTAALVGDLAAREHGRRRVLVTSFDPAGLLIVRDRAPGVPIGLITWTRFPLRKAIPAAAHLGAEVVVASFESFPLGDPATARTERDAAHSVAVAHQAGLQVAAWCPPPEQAQLLVGAGVDCLVVDQLGRAAG